MAYVSAAAREREIRRLFREWAEHINGADPAIEQAKDALIRHTANRNHFRAERARCMDLTRQSWVEWRAERKKLRERARTSTPREIDPLTVQTLSQLVNDVQIFPQLPDPKDLELPPCAPFSRTGPWLYVQTHTIDVRGAGLLVARYAVALKLPECRLVRLWKLDGTGGIAHPNCPQQGSTMCLRDFTPLLHAAYLDRDIVKLVTLLVGILSEGTLDSYMYSYFRDRWTRAQKERNLEAHQ